MGHLSPYKMGPFLLSAVFYILVIHSTKAAPFEDIPVRINSHFNSSGRGCYYMNKLYPSGAEIETNEPCLNCTCLGNTLMCYLRICPYVKPLGEDCRMEKHVGECCPQFWCPEVSAKSSTEKPDEDIKGCFLEGKYYGEGARIPMNPANPCEVCYCIRNTSVCTMQQCELQVEGCFPEYKFGSCCPSRYNCTEEAATTVPPGIMEPHEYEGCLSGGVMYKDGEKVPSPDNCQTCYCMKHEVVCANQKCMAPSEDCTPLEIEPGQCCPDKYDCPNATEADETSTPTWLTTLSAKTSIANETTAKAMTFGITDLISDSTSGIHLSSFVTTKDFEISTLGTPTKLILDEKAESRSSFPTVSDVTTGAFEMDAEVTESEIMSNITQTPIELVSRPREAKITEVPDDMFTSRATKRPVIYPKRVPGEGICRHQNKTYQSGENVTTSDPCLQNCVCINSVIRCEKVECDLSPPDSRELCKVKQSPGECCPRYVCTNATIEKIADEEMTTSEEDLLLAQKSTHSTFEIDQTSTTPSISEDITATTSEIISLKTTLDTQKVADHSIPEEVRESTTSTSTVVEDRPVTEKQAVTESEDEMMTSVKGEEKSTYSPEITSSTPLADHELASVKETSKTSPESVSTQEISTETSTHPTTEATPSKSSLATTLAATAISEESSQTTAGKLDTGSTAASETPFVIHKTESTSVMEDHTTTRITTEETTPDTHTEKSSVEEMDAEVTTISSTLKFTENITAASSPAVLLNDTKEEKIGLAPTTHGISTVISEKELTEAEFEDSSVKTTTKTSLIFEETETPSLSSSSAPPSQAAGDETTQKISEDITKDILSSVSAETSETIEVFTTSDIVTQAFPKKEPTTLSPTTSTDLPKSEATSELASTPASVEAISPETTKQSETQFLDERILNVTRIPESTPQEKTDTTTTITELPSSPVTEAAQNQTILSTTVSKEIKLSTTAQIAESDSKTTLTDTSTATYKPTDSFSLEAETTVSEDITEEISVHEDKTSEATVPTTTSFETGEIKSTTSKILPEITTLLEEKKLIQTTAVQDIEEITTLKEIQITPSSEASPTELSTIAEIGTSALLSETEEAKTVTSTAKPDDKGAIELKQDTSTVLATGAPTTTEKDYSVEIESTVTKLQPTIMGLAGTKSTTVASDEKETKIAISLSTVEASKDTSTSSMEAETTEMPIVSSISSEKTSTMETEISMTTDVIREKPSISTLSDASTHITEPVTVTVKEMKLATEIPSTTAEIKTPIEEEREVTSKDEHKTTISETQEPEIQKAPTVLSETTSIKPVSSVEITSSTIFEDLTSITGITAGKVSDMTSETKPIELAEISTEVADHKEDKLTSESISFKTTTTVELSTEAPGSSTEGEESEATLFEKSATPTTEKSETEPKVSATPFEDEKVSVTLPVISTETDELKTSILSGETVKPLPSSTSKPPEEETSTKEVTSFGTLFSETLKTTVQDVEEKETSSTSTTGITASSESDTKTDDVTTFSSSTKGEDISLESFTSISESTKQPDVGEQISTLASISTSEISKDIEISEAETTTVLPFKVTPEKELPTTESTLMSTIQEKKETTKPESLEMEESTTSSALKSTVKTSPLEEKLQTETTSVTGQTDFSISKLTTTQSSEKELTTIEKESPATESPEKFTHTDTDKEFTLKAESIATSAEGTMLEEISTKMPAITTFKTETEGDYQSTRVSTTYKAEEAISTTEKTVTSESKDASTPISIAFDVTEEKTSHRVDDKTTTMADITKLETKLDTTTAVTAGVFHETIEHGIVSESKSTKSTTDITTSKPVIGVETIATTEKTVDLDTSPETLLSKTGTISPSVETTKTPLSSEADKSSPFEKETSLSETETEAEISAETTMAEPSSTILHGKTTPGGISTTAFPSSEFKSTTTTSLSSHEADVETAETKFSVPPSSILETTTRLVAFTSELPIEKLITEKTHEDEDSIQTVEPVTRKQISTLPTSTAESTFIRDTTLPEEASTRIASTLGEISIASEVQTSKPDVTTKASFKHTVKASSEMETIATASVAEDKNETSVTSKFTTSEESVQTTPISEEILHDTKEIEVIPDKISTQHPFKAEESTGKTETTFSDTQSTLKTSTLKPILDFSTEKTVTDSSIIEEAETTEFHEIAEVSSMETTHSRVTDEKLSEAKYTGTTAEEKISTPKDIQTTTTTPQMFEKTTTEELLDAEVTTASRTTIDTLLTSEKIETTKLSTSFVASEITATQTDEEKKEIVVSPITTVKPADSTPAKAVSFSAQTQKEVKAESVTPILSKVTGTTFKSESMTTESTKQTELSKEVSTPIELSTKEFEVTIVSEDELQSKKTFAADSMVVTSPTTPPITEPPSKPFSSELDRAGAIVTDVPSTKGTKIPDGSTEEVETDISSGVTVSSTTEEHTDQFTTKLEKDKVSVDSTEKAEAEPAGETTMSSTTGHPHQFTTRLEKHTPVEEEERSSLTTEDVLLSETIKLSTKFELPITTSFPGIITSSTPEVLTKTTLLSVPTQERDETVSEEIKFVSEFESTTSHLDQKEGSTTTPTHTITDKEVKDVEIKTELPSSVTEATQKSEGETTMIKELEDISSTSKKEDVSSTSPSGVFSTEIHMDIEKTSVKEEASTLTTLVEETEEKTTKLSTLVSDKIPMTSKPITTEEETMEAELTTVSADTDDISKLTSAEIISTTSRESKTTTSQPTDILSKKRPSAEEMLSPELQLETETTSPKPEQTPKEDISTTSAQQTSTVEQSLAAETVISTVTASSEDTEKAGVSSTTTTDISEGSEKPKAEPTTVISTKTSVETFESSTIKELAPTEEKAKVTEFMFHPTTTTSGKALESSSTTVTESVTSEKVTEEASAVTESTSSTATTIVSDLKTEVAEAEAAVTTTTRPITEKVVSTVVTEVPFLKESTTMPTEKNKCRVNDTVYEDGDSIVTLEPCEKCSCYSGEILCYKIICKLPRVDCRPLSFDGGDCCPLSFECPLDNGTTETVSFASTEALDEHVTTTISPEKPIHSTTHLTPETLFDAAVTHSPFITTQSPKELTSEEIPTDKTTKVAELSTGTIYSKTESKPTISTSSIEADTSESTVSILSSISEVSLDSKTTKFDLQKTTQSVEEAETTTSEGDQSPTTAKIITTEKLKLTTQPEKVTEESSSLSTSEASEGKTTTESLSVEIQTTKTVSPEDLSSASETTKELKVQTEISTTFRSDETIESSSLSTLSPESTKSESVTPEEKVTTVEDEVKQTTIEERTKLFDADTTSEIVTEHSESEAETSTVFESLTVKTSKPIDLSETSETTLKTTSSEFFEDQTEKVSETEEALKESTKFETVSKAISLTTTAEVTKSQDVPTSTVSSSSQFTTGEALQTDLSSIQPTEKTEATHSPLSSTQSGETTISEVSETDVSKVQTLESSEHETMVKQLTSTEPSIKTETKEQLTSFKPSEVTKEELVAISVSSISDKKTTETFFGDDKKVEDVTFAPVSTEEQENIQKSETVVTTFVTQTIPKLHTIPIMSRGRLPSSTIQESMTEVMQDVTTEKAKSDLSAETLVPETASEKEITESPSTTISEAASETTSIKSITDKVFTFVSTRFTELFSDTTKESVEPELTTKIITAMETSTVKPVTTIAHEEKTITMMAEDMESKSEMTSKGIIPEATAKDTEAIPISSTITEKIEEVESETKFTTVMERSEEKSETDVPGKEMTVTTIAEDTQTKSEETSKSITPETTQRVTETPAISSISEEIETKLKLTTVVEASSTKSNTAVDDGETTVTMMAEDMESKSEVTSKSTMIETAKRVTETPSVTPTTGKSEETETRLSTPREESTMKTSSIDDVKETTIRTTAEDMESELTSKSTVPEITQRVTETPAVTPTTGKSEEIKTETRLSTLREESTTKSSSIDDVKETTIRMMAEDMESESTSKSTEPDITQRAKETPTVSSITEKGEETETKVKFTTVGEESSTKSSTSVTEKETKVTMTIEDMELKSEMTSKSDMAETTQKVTETTAFSSTTDKSKKLEAETKLTTIVEEGSTTPSSSVVDKEITITMMAEDMESKSEVTSQSTTPETSRKMTEISIAQSTTEELISTTKQEILSSTMRTPMVKSVEDELELFTRESTQPDKVTDERESVQTPEPSSMPEEKETAHETSASSIGETSPETMSTGKTETVEDDSKTTSLLTTFSTSLGITEATSSQSEITKKASEIEESFTTKAEEPEITSITVSHLENLTLSLETEKPTVKAIDITEYESTLSSKLPTEPAGSTKAVQESEMTTKETTTISSGTKVSTKSETETSPITSTVESFKTTKVHDIITEETNLTETPELESETIASSTSVDGEEIKSTIGLETSESDSEQSKESSTPGLETKAEEGATPKVTEKPIFKSEDISTSAGTTGHSEAETEKSSPFTSTLAASTDTAEAEEVTATESSVNKTDKPEGVSEVKITETPELESETIASSPSVHAEEIKSTVGLETSESVSEQSKESSTPGLETKAEEGTTPKVTEKPIFKTEDLSTSAGTTGHSEAETEKSSPFTSKLAASTDTAEAEEVTATESSVNKTDKSEGVAEVKVTEYVSSVTFRPTTIAGIPLSERRLPTDRTEYPVTEDLDQASKSTIISTVSTSGIPVTMIRETTTSESFETETRVSTAKTPISTISEILRSPTTIVSFETETKFSTTEAPISMISEIIRSPTTSETETRISTTGIVVKNLTERVTEATEMPTKAYKAIETTTFSSTPMITTTEETSTRSVTDFLLDEGACIFDGRIYQSAEQILRDDPCEFCFCFRGDIICLQQTCPPPAPNCERTEIPGFCCPRYDCPVLVTSKNLTAITRRKGVQPIIIQQRIEKRSVRLPTVVKGCDINGTFYEVGSTVTSASWPCLHCMCEDGGNMHCDPRKCKPESPLMLNMTNSLTKTR